MKKLIEIGWDYPTIQFVKDNIHDMEKRPFDGVVMGLSHPNAIENKYMKNRCTIFHHRPFPESDYYQDWKAIENLKSDKFTDNFLLMWLTPEEGWDWFSESDWEASLQNVRMFARTARLGNFAGLIFDPEMYTPDRIWTYNVLKNRDKSGRSFEEYTQKVQQRGSEFIQVVQEEFPDVKLLCLWLLMQMPLWRPYHRIEHRQNSLMDASYGLLSWFTAGMLASAQGKTEIIDGNEYAYYYTHQVEFENDRLRFKTEMPLLLDDVVPGSGLKFDQHLRYGCGAYYNYIMIAERLSEIWFQGRLPFWAIHLTHQERLMWMEHNVYYSLATADEYTWYWNEKMNWWTGDIMEGLESALDSARRKIALNQPLGFDNALYDSMTRARLKTLTR